MEQKIRDEIRREIIDYYVERPERIEDELKILQYQASKLYSHLQNSVRGWVTQKWLFKEYRIADEKFTPSYVLARSGEIFNFMGDQIQVGLKSFKMEKKIK